MCFQLNTKPQYMPNLRNAMKQTDRIKQININMAMSVVWTIKIFKNTQYNLLSKLSLVNPSYCYTNSGCVSWNPHTLQDTTTVMWTGLEHDKKTCPAAASSTSYRNQHEVLLVDISTH